MISNEYPGRKSMGRMKRRKHLIYPANYTIRLFLTPDLLDTSHYCVSRVILTRPRYKFWTHFFQTTFFCTIFFRVPSHHLKYFATTICHHASNSDQFLTLKVVQYLNNLTLEFCHLKIQNTVNYLN